MSYEGGKRIIPASALQHFAFCQTQCALIHINLAWEENTQTQEGKILHSKTDNLGISNHKERQILTGVTIYDENLGLSAKPDRIVFEDSNVYPYEMKHGKTKSEPWDEIQLCAGGLCLEYTLKKRINYGILYYWKERKSQTINFNENLRKLTIKTLDETRALLESEIIPKGLKNPKCRNCSLKFQCLPS